MTFRWSTKVLTGQWRRTERGALLDALRAGQAEAIDEDIVLHPFTHIERKEGEGLLSAELR